MQGIAPGGPGDAPKGAAFQPASDRPSKDARTGIAPSLSCRDRAEVRHGRIGALHRALSEGQQEALHRALQAVSDVGPEALALARAVRRPDVGEALDRALDLSGGGAAGLLSALGGMSPEDADATLKALADLLRQGVVGYEYREVNGEPMKVFIDAAIGSDLHRAPPLREGRIDVLL